MDKSREQFIEWFHSRYDSISMPPQERAMLFTNQWASWQASRAAVEVNLPGWFYDGHKDKCLDFDDTVRCLNDHGLKVKQ